jgi:hypothetical protein
MVSNDEKFKKFSKNYTKWTDKDLFEFRKEQIYYLFAGETGSQDNEERKSLIDLVDKEFERRYKLRTERISIIALIISIISLLISIFRN